MLMTRRDRAISLSPLLLSTSSLVCLYLSLPSPKQSPNSSSRSFKHLCIQNTINMADVKDPKIAEGTCGTVAPPDDSLREDQE